MKKSIFILSLLFVTQVDAKKLFESSRIINAHSTELLERGILDFRITHKFGDIGGSNGGFHTLYGLDNASDIRIAFEYGLSNSINLGLGRSKGVFIPELFDGFLKYSPITQGDKYPFSLTWISSIAITATKSASIENSLHSFENTKQRLSYIHELLLATKLKNWLSVQTMGLHSYRQLVFDTDQNNLLSVGLGARFRLSKVVAVLLDYYHTFSNQNRSFNSFTPRNPWGLGLEINTGAHTFFINVTNAQGITENEFIPYTISQFNNGEYRLGFTISRPFRIAKNKSLAKDKK